MCIRDSLYLLAPVLFDAALPAYPGHYFAELAFFLVVSLSIASIVGLAVKDPAKTSMAVSYTHLESTRRAFLRCGELRQDHDLDRYNNGVTFILL